MPYSFDLKSDDAICRLNLGNILKHHNDRPVFNEPYRMMKSYSVRNILIAVDLSEPSLNALDTAVALAMKHKANIQLLNVIEKDIPRLLDDTVSLPFNILSNSSDVLTALGGAIEHSNDVKLKLMQEEGNVTETIIKTSLLHQSDLIVMGTHGASGFRDGFIGSNAYSVIKHSYCPVLTIPPRKKYTSFNKVMIPIRPVTNALARYDVVRHFLNPSALIEVFGLSYQKMERDVSLLDRLVEEVKEDLKDDKVTTNCVWSLGNNIAEEVLYFAQQTNPELIVVTNALDVTTKPNFIGPHTQKIINAARMPLLNIKKIGVPALA